MTCDWCFKEIEPNENIKTAQKRSCTAVTQVVYHDTPEKPCFDEATEWVKSRI